MCYFDPINKYLQNSPELVTPWISSSFSTSTVFIRPILLLIFLVLFIFNACTKTVFGMLKWTQETIHYYQNNIVFVLLSILFNFYFCSIFFYKWIHNTHACHVIVSRYFDLFLWFLRFTCRVTLKDFGVNIIIVRMAAHSKSNDLNVWRTLVSLICRHVKVRTSKWKRTLNTLNCWSQSGQIKVCRVWICAAECVPWFFFLHG